MGRGLKKEFAKYVSLNVMGMTGLSCYILADTFFISKRLGADGLTALNLAIAVYSVINGLGLMLGVGGATRYAICRAQKEKEEADRVFTETVLWGLGLGAFLAFAGFFLSRNLAGILGAKGLIQDMTGTYLKTIFGFAPFFIINNIFIAFIRNDGEPRLSMAAMLAGSFSNIALDYVFLFPCNMGMFGAAFATGLAPVISMGILSVYIIKGKNHFHLSFAKERAGRIGDICGLGISALINELSSAVVLIVFNLLILNLAGNTGVAAYGIVANLALVAIAVFTGIAQGSQPLVSRYYGEGNKRFVRKIFKYAVISAAVTGLLFTVSAFLFAEPLVKIFNSEGNRKLGEIAQTGLCIYFTGFAPAGLNMIAAACLGALEQPVHSFGIAFSRGFLAILFWVFLLSGMLGMQGIWMAFPAAEITTVVYTGLKCRKLFL